MSSVLPHNAQIRQDVSSYLSEARNIVTECTSKVETSGDYRNLYKSCLACDSVLQKLSTSRETPRLAVARGLIQRVPLLAAIGQLPACHNELRRFVEVVLWCIYFTDHPVEWQAFSGDPSRGFAKDLSTPITFCAFRERAFYSNYAEELFQCESSGIAAAASKQLSVIYNELNADVHAAHAATTTGFKPAWDSLTNAELASLAKKHRIVCSNSCIVLSAHFRQRFDKLPPVHRAWFDWLVGSNLAKKVRSTSFGL